MLVYNIRKERYSHQLIASGVANRWNKNDEFIIYTGSSRALSALELIVHKSSIGVNTSYKLLVIDLKIGEKDITEITIEQLPENWRSIKSYVLLQSLGSDWYKKQKTLVLKVPSAIVSKEYNYLINTKHPDFSKKVNLKEIEDFLWDERLF
jgi:RES domain-containing protein